MSNVCIKKVERVEFLWPGGTTTDTMKWIPNGLGINYPEIVQGPALVRTQC